MSKKKTKNNTKENKFNKNNIKKQIETLKNTGDEIILKGKHQHHIIRFPDNEYYYIHDNKVTTDELYTKENLIELINKDET